MEGYNSDYLKYAPVSSNGIGQAQGAQQMVKQTTMLEALHHELMQLHEIISANNHRLQTMCDRVTGPQPQAAENSTSTPQPSGMMREVAQRLELLKRSVQSQSGIISHLETVL